MTHDRVIAWFSCGAASAVAAFFALDKYGPDRLVIAYCDMSKDEHPDNVRFRNDVESWLNHPIEVLRSSRYVSVEEVFADRRYMSGLAGAPCTVEMKKVPRFEFQHIDDIHVFGYTQEEKARITRFEKNNPDLRLDWVLRDNGIGKQDCFDILSDAGIALPVLYAKGFRNNNCIGCVKSSSPKYWALVRREFPEVFERRARQSRDIGCRLIRIKGTRMFLDELPVDDFHAEEMPDISCGPECRGESGNAEDLRDHDTDDRSAVEPRPADQTPEEVEGVSGQ